MKQIKAALFDFDGVLANTEPYMINIGTKQEYVIIPVFLILPLSLKGQPCRIY